MNFGFAFLSQGEDIMVIYGESKIEANCNLWLFSSISFRKPTNEGLF